MPVGPKGVIPTMPAIALNSVKPWLTLEAQSYPRTLSWSEPLFFPTEDALIMLGLVTVSSVTENRIQRPKTHWWWNSKRDASWAADSPISKKERPVLTDRSSSPSWALETSHGSQCSLSLSCVVTTWPASPLSSVFHKTGLAGSRAWPQEDKSPWTWTFRNTWTLAGHCTSSALQGHFLNSTEWDLLQIWKLVILGPGHRS